MNDFLMLGTAALFAASTWLLVALCDALKGTDNERK